jgi:hypothetical protein
MAKGIFGGFPSVKFFLSMLGIMQAICALLSVFGFVLHQVRSWLNAQV